MARDQSSILNDVNINAVAGLVRKIQQEPEVAATKWSAQVKWKGGFRSEATIRDFAPIPSDEPYPLRLNSPEDFAELGSGLDFTDDL